MSRKIVLHYESDVSDDFDKSLAQATALAEIHNKLKPELEKLGGKLEPLRYSEAPTQVGVVRRRRRTKLEMMKAA